MSVLPFLILVPLLAALLTLFGGPARKLSLAASWFMLGLSLLEFTFYRKPYSYEVFTVAPALDLKFMVGADGLSLMMALLTSIVTLSAIWVTPKIENGENAFYACLLFISAGAMGAFLSFDLFFLYAFHELALIPTFLLIGVWGHGDNRVAAAWKITIYLAVGSFVLLLGLIWLYLSVPPNLRTFDLIKLQNLPAGTIPISAQNRIYPVVLIGFGILISLFPFHTWAAPAYAAAPTPAAMLHAGVLKKFGLYGLLRIAVPMLPAGMQHWMNWLLILLVGNILYVGLVAIAQKRLDTLLGCSSVMHMGYIFLGIASLNVIGLTGASLLMFAHGLSIAALFAVAGEVRARTGTMFIDKLGGLARSMPYLSVVFGTALFASIGLPGFANFASEVMVFFGAFMGDINGGAHLFSVRAGVATTGVHLDRFQVAVICALWGVVISAVYMLRAYRRVFLGEPSVTAANLAEVPKDLQGSPRWALAILIAALAVVGFKPSLLVDRIKPVAERAIHLADRTLRPGAQALQGAAVTAAIPPQDHRLAAPGY
jgi:NADH-quinone oxidoreductase subunit M